MFGVTDMNLRHWLTIIGIGEDGMDGLSVPSRAALAAAERIMAPTRHLSLLSGISCPMIEWRRLRLHGP